MTQHKQGLTFYLERIRVRCTLAQLCHAAEAVKYYQAKRIK